MFISVLLLINLCFKYSQIKFQINWKYVSIMEVIYPQLDIIIQASFSNSGKYLNVSLFITDEETNLFFISVRPE